MRIQLAPLLACTLLGCSGAQSTAAEPLDNETPLPEPVASLPSDAPEAPASVVPEVVPPSAKVSEDSRLASGGERSEGSSEVGRAESAPDESGEIQQDPVAQDPAALPQTQERPSSGSEVFRQRASQLFDAIVADDVERAMPVFFPLAAYEQVKNIPNPGQDWEARLRRAFKKDIHQYHRSLGQFRAEARFEEIRVADELARWVEPGKEVNKVGYYRVMRSVLVYRDHQERKRELGIVTMISWRGEWYVIHLAPFK